MKRFSFINKSIVIFSVACFLLNVILSKLVSVLSLPIFLDSVGTITAAILCGIIPGMLVGIATNLMNAVSDPISLYYAILSIMLAVFAAGGAKRGAFKSAGKTVLLILIFAVIGGGLGSVLTWLLYGFSVGSGISVPLTVFIRNQLQLSDFYAQLSADMIIDLLDKTITVILVCLFLRIAGDNLLRYLPYGYRYMKNPDASVNRATERTWYYMQDNKRHISLRTKVASIIIITSLFLGSLSVTIGTLLYKTIMDSHFTEVAQSAANLVVDTLDGDEVQYYYETGIEDERYREIESDLNMIRDNMPRIKYIYVYHIEEDGCHVIFDLDTNDVEGCVLGEKISFDTSFETYVPSLLRGEEIPPISANGQYGRLLTVYKPIFNSSGNCVAYGAVDIGSEEILSESWIFAIRLICLFFVASVLILSCALRYIQQRVVDPMDKLADVSGRFAYDTDANREKNLALIHELDINTNDEIENLYHAIYKTTDDMCAYVQELREKSDEIISQAKVITELQDRIIIAFAAMVESRDQNTGGHIYRTAQYVNILAEQMAKDPRFHDILTEERVENIVKSAPLHDIGKIKIPDVILNKPGALTPEEFEVIKSHTTAGMKILDDVFHDISGENYFTLAVNMAYCHHEKWNGQGYPRGIRGEEIPLCARIMALADVFDALTSKRSYKKAFSVDKAAEIILAEAGKQFDPAVVDAFRLALEDFRAVAEKNHDAAENNGDA